MTEQNAPSRRLFLAAGPAAVVFGSLKSATATAATASTPAAKSISELIEWHRIAWQKFEDICDYDDHIEKSDPAYAIAAVESERWNEAEETTLDAVCAAPALTLEEARTKGEYLRAFLTHGELTERQYRLVIDGLIPPAT